jgi:hypothetical protein
MAAPSKRSSLPRIVGWIAILLALVYAVPCVLTSPSEGDQIALGMRLTGPLGWTASLLHAVFFFWLAYVALYRRSIAVWGVVGYCVYLMENVWIFSVGEGRQFLPSIRSMVISNGLLTAVLLTVCRQILKRRDEFDA